MPLDAICLQGLTKELQTVLPGAKIDKVQQPERDMILLSLRGKNGNCRLLIAAGTGNARVHLTQASFENPAEPPMFCMLLRKHLLGARIATLEQPEHERMLVMELETYDDLGFSARKKLVVEMMGRSSNLILVDSDGRILDCMRRMDFGGDAMRSLLPGMIYRMPPKQTKPNLFSLTEDERRDKILSANKEQPVEKWLMESFSGLSPLICRELAYRSGGDYAMLPTLLDAFAESVEAGELQPYLFYEEKTPLDFSFMDLRQYGSEILREKTASFSEMLDRYYTGRDRLAQQRRRAHDLTKTVKILRDRQQRKLAGQAEEYRRTEEREQIRKTAELITANLYRVRKGDRVLRCQDYYDPDCPEIEIPLDPLKSPQQNAAALYKEYNKLKTAREYLDRLIREGEVRLDYLNSVLALIEEAETERDLADLRRELVETGVIRAPRTRKPEKGKVQAPLRFRSDDGFEILVGRSNLQNDELTTKIGRRTDYWLHTQRIHGSHVLIRCEGENPSETAIKQAAVIAAYYSQGRGGGKIPVDYTMLRFVRKPSGAMPGKVIYTDYNSITVEGDENLVRRLQIK